MAGWRSPRGLPRGRRDCGGTAPLNIPGTIAEAAAWLRDGRTDPVALTAALITRAKATQPALGAFVAIAETAALEAARRAADELRGGIDRGPLHGIPIAVKDILATVDAPTTANGRALDPLWGRGRDAVAVARLRQAGAIVVGKAALHEFAIGAPDPAFGYGTPRNPWDTSRSPGGSSSGTAVAISAGLALGGVGTDTGGSIRQPSAFCGITGLKPTTGLVSTDGCVPLAPTLDCVGPMARTAADCALLLEAMVGVARLPAADLRRTRIGIAERGTLDVPGLDPGVTASVRSAIDRMSDLGATIVPIDLPLLAEASAANTIILRSEALAQHREGFRAHPDRYGRWMREAVLVGALFDSEDLACARRLRSALASRWDASLAGVDALVTPTVPRPAAPAGRRPPPGLLAGPSFTNVWSLVGFPAVSVPCGVTADGLPIGMQLVGRPFTDATVLAVADAYQRACGMASGLVPPGAAEMRW